MYINHNGMATNVANTLTGHYGNLQTSTQRLSSGMRINSAVSPSANSCAPTLPPSIRASATPTTVFPLSRPLTALWALSTKS